MNRFAVFVFALASMTLFSVSAFASSADFALEQKVRRNMGHTSGISVQADNGTVVLSGEVDTLRQREAAIAAARSLEGVNRVDSRIAISSHS